MRKFEKHKFYSLTKGSIWKADLADMQLISKHNKVIQFLLCITDICSKYARLEFRIQEKDYNY